MTYPSNDFFGSKIYIEQSIVGCRPIMRFDDFHLKLKYLGEILSSDSIDGNNYLFIIAFMIVETE